MATKKITKRPEGVSVREKNGFSSSSSISKEKKPPKSMSWSSTRVFWLTSCVSLAVYLPTVPPSVVGGDTGELLAEACQLGIAHPPGYPLYTMLAHLATRLGPNYWDKEKSPAYYANCMSCLFGAIASGLLSAGVLLYTEYHDGTTGAAHTASSGTKRTTSLLREAAAVTAGLLHSFSPLAWQHHVTAEVFALHNLFVALLIYMALRFAWQPTSSRMLFLGSFLCGLTMTNQHTSVLLDIPIILWVLYETRLYASPRRVVQVVGCFLAGLIPYVYLPVSAIWFPHRGSWGDTTTWIGFLNHVRRKDYGTFQLHVGESEEDLLYRLSVWFYDFCVVQTGNASVALFFGYGLFVTLCPFLVAIISRGTEREWPSVMNRAGVMLHLSLLFYVLGFFYLANAPITSMPQYLGIFKRFWLHPNMICFWFLGVGMHGFAMGLAKDTSARKAVAMILMAASVLYSYWTSASVSDQSSNLVLRNYGRAVLASVPENALILTSTDVDWMALRYLQECEGERPDVMAVSLTMMKGTWWASKANLHQPFRIPGQMIVRENDPRIGSGGYTFMDLLDANYDSYSDNMFQTFDQPELYVMDERRYQRYKYGILSRITRADRVPASVEEYRTETLKPWKVVRDIMADDVFDASRYPAESFELLTRETFFTRLSLRGSGLLRSARTGNKSLSAIMEAALWTEIPIKYDQASSTNLKNLGIAYLEMTWNTETEFESSPPPVDDFFGGEGLEGWWTKESEYESWKAWAKFRWYKAFGAYLEMEDAMNDPEFNTIKELYESTAFTK